MSLIVVAAALNIGIAQRDQAVNGRRKPDSPTDLSLLVLYLNKSGNNLLTVSLIVFKAQLMLHERMVICVSYYRGELLLNRELVRLYLLSVMKLYLPKSTNEQLVVIIIKKNV